MYRNDYTMFTIYRNSMIRFLYKRSTGQGQRSDMTFLGCYTCLSPFDSKPLPLLPSAEHKRSSKFMLRGDESLGQQSAIPWFAGFLNKVVFPAPSSCLVTQGPVLQPAERAQIQLQISKQNPDETGPVGNLNHNVGFLIYLYEKLKD